MRRTISATPKSRAARRLRRTMFVVIFSALMARKMVELRWGQYVEHGENLLLEAKEVEIAPHYLDALVACPLPPGWISSVLPPEVRQQILTYAKNKLVNIVTPIAKRRAHKYHVSLLRDQLQGEAVVLTDTLLRKLSPMFETWSPAALDEALRVGRKVAYRAGMWIQPPTKQPYWNVNGLVILHGTVAEVQLKANQDSDLGRAQSPPREHVAPTVVAETRNVLATPSTVGYLSKTQVLIYEISFQDLQRIGDSLTGTHRDKYKRFVSTGRGNQVTQAFHLTAAMLSAMPFFEEFSEPDLHMIAQSAKPRVAFENDVVVAAGATVHEVIIVCRGKMNIFAGGGSQTFSTTGLNGCAPVDGAASSASVPVTSKAQPLSSIREHEVFGPDFLVFEDRCTLSLVAACPTEYWVTTSASLHGVLKNTFQRKQLAEAAARRREAMLLLTRDPAAIEQTLRMVPAFAELMRKADPFDSTVRELLSLAIPKVFRPGDRLVSAGEDVSALIMIHSGRINKLVVTATGGGGVDDEAEDASRRVAPCVIGENFLLRGKWSCSYTASRLCETWTLSRADVWRILRGDPAAQALVRKAVHAAHRSKSNTTPNSATLSGHHHPQPQQQQQQPYSFGLSPAADRDHASARHSMVGASASALAAARSDVMSNVTDESPHRGKPATLASSRRALARAAQKAERKEKEDKEIHDALQAERRRRRGLAPNIANRVPFVQYEGLHPVKPSAKEAYEAVRKIHPLPPAPRPPSLGPHGASPKDSGSFSGGPPSQGGSVVPPRRPSKAAPPRSDKLTIRERLAEEVEEQASKLRRLAGAALLNSTSSSAGAGSASTRPTTAVSRAQRKSVSAHWASHVEVDIRPSVGKAEKTLLKQIMAQHDAIIVAKRTQAEKASDTFALASANPFSSLEAQGSVHKLSPTGELFFQQYGSAKIQPFHAKTYQHHSPTSYLSAHAFSEL